MVGCHRLPEASGGPAPPGAHQGLAVSAGGEPAFQGLPLLDLLCRELRWARDQILRGGCSMDQPELPHGEGARLLPICIHIQ